MAAVAASLARQPPRRLRRLPLEVAEEIHRLFLRDAGLAELRAFAAAFWRPRELALSKVQGMSGFKLHRLAIFSDSLIRLDLSNCAWLEDLAPVAALPKLRCLDLENAVQVDEASAIRFLSGSCFQYVTRMTKSSLLISGMSSLIALNASGTTIGTTFIEFATYGLRLRNWQYEQGKASCRSISCEMAESNWPLCKLEYLSLARAPVHPSSVSHLLGKRAACFLNFQGFKGGLRCNATKQLCFIIGIIFIAALKNLVLLDVRQTEVTGRALQPLRAFLNLVAVPNNAKLLARSSAVLMSHLQGACGCMALGWASARLMDNNERKQANAQSSGWAQIRVMASSKSV
eukprot:SM000211S06654  [mRNA]  locus=s211:196955:199429:- [translate_table: standard]